MRILLTSVALALLATPAVAETRPLSGFTKISASAGTRVDVSVGGDFRVDVEGRDAARIVTRVSNGTLVVEPVRGWSWRGPRDAIVRVSMPSVEALDASSGADIDARGVAGGAIELDASSGASIDVVGVCAAFDADASSGASIDAQAMQCETGSVDVSSGANARVFASGRLNVDASSGGGVEAYGDPGIGDISLSSGGSLRRR
jgi:Putative auto-transporter adhesin, head GIN domain